MIAVFDNSQRKFLMMQLYNTFLTKIFLPITRRQILDSSKLKEVVDGNFKFDKNGRKLSKRVENTVGKGEISPFPTVFS